MSTFKFWCQIFFRLEVVSTLLHVFVDIEMTGQAVAFEMKFSYRRPMYEIMKYLWQMDGYKKRSVPKHWRD
jgi:ubiquitin conjugation factor E4 A